MFRSYYCMVYFNENKYIRWVFDIIIIVFIVNKYARVGVKETPNDSRHYSYNFKKMNCNIMIYLKIYLHAL